MNFPHDFDTDQLMELLDMATDALETIAEAEGKLGDIAVNTLESIAHKTMKWMEAE